MGGRTQPLGFDVTLEPCLGDYLETLRSTPIFTALDGLQSVAREVFGLLRLK